jgi:hypothetical protein
MNLRHPCISSVIGVVLPTELNLLKIIGNDFRDNSGLVLGLRFAHSYGLLHGHLTGNTVFFNENGVIQITDFG